MKRKFRWFSRRSKHASAMIAAIMVLPFTSGMANAAPVLKVISHGAVSAGPVSYGVYQGDLYYTIGDQLLHMDGESNAVTEVPLPEGLGSSVDLDAEFVTFDGALIFHASRAFGNAAGSGRFLHRLVRDGDNYDITLIDVPEEPRTEEFNWVFERGYADDTMGLAVYKEQLFFFATQATPVAADGFLTRALYQLESAAATPERVRWNTARAKIETYDLKSTDDGILLDYKLISNPIDDADDFAAYTVISEPVAAQPFSLDVESEDYPMVTVPGQEPESVYFNGHVYYATANYDVGRTWDDPRGPLADPDDNVVTTGATPYQVELGRMDAMTGERVYFDLVVSDPDDQNTIDTPNVGSGGGSVAVTNPTALQNVISARIYAAEFSSAPYNFVPAGETLWFNATDNWRLTALNWIDSDDEDDPATGTIGSLNRQIPIAWVNGKFWFSGMAGYTGNIDLLRRDGSRGPYTATMLGDDVGKTATSFTAFGAATVFTARDETGDWGTYLYRPSTDPVNTPLITTLSIDDGIYMEAPGPLLTEGSWMYATCTVTNNSSATIRNIHISIKESTPLREPRLKEVCERSSLAPGQTIYCDLDTQVKRDLRRYNCKVRTDDGVIARKRQWITGLSR